ncbi:MAG: hypothetical protein RMM58_02905 [Chloroflexota bacterium]|nr:hypothetical protein [Chloroflexota bacterium]
MGVFARAGAPPGAPRLAPAVPLDRDLGGGRRLLGYDLPARRLLPGDVGHIALYWRAGDRSAGPLAVRLIDTAGIPLEEWIVDDEGAPSGSVLRRQFEFVAHRYTPSGTYQLEIETPAVRQRLATLRIDRTEPAPQPPAAARLQTVGEFGDWLRLAGASVTAGGRPLVSGDQVRPGETLEVTLDWQPLRRLDRSWVVFTHLRGSELNPLNATPLWGQDDGYPLRGDFPTHQWRPGTIVRDTRRFVVDPTAPPGRYAIEVGMYWPATGERLPTAAGEGRLVVLEVTVPQ